MEKSIANIAKLPVLPHTNLKLNKLPKLVITKEFQKLFEYFCSRARQLEWSGIMFYKVEGTFDNINSMVVTPIDILLMDIGSQAHTEFMSSGSVFEYQMTNISLMSCQLGLIHSHNTMKTFFSGEDISELNDTVQLIPYYVSLIINNASESCAKLAFKGEVQQTFSYNTSLNQVNPQLSNIKASSNYSLVTVDFDIVNEVDNTIDVKYVNRYNELDKIKKASIKTTFASVGNNQMLQPTLFSSKSYTSYEIQQFLIKLIDSKEKTLLSAIKKDLIGTDFTVKEIKTFTNNSFEEFFVKEFKVFPSNTIMLNFITNCLNEIVKLYNTNTLPTKVVAFINGIKEYQKFVNKQLKDDSKLDSDFNLSNTPFNFDIY